MPDEPDDKICSCHGLSQSIVNTDIMNGYTERLRDFMSENNFCPNANLLAAFATFLIVNCLKQGKHPMQFMQWVGSHLAEAIRDENIRVQTFTAKKPS